MTNNDVLRSLRYTLDLSDSKLISLFGTAGRRVTAEQLGEWLKKEDDPAYKNLGDADLAAFLNGLIVERRGRKEGPQAPPEKRMNNNIIFRKLKIAFDLKSEDILAILSLADLPMGKHELSAFFRRPDQKNYRECKDQVLRNFLRGLKLRHRPGK